jgi:hypothetical protein
MAISGLFLRISRLTGGKSGGGFHDKNVVRQILSDMDVSIRRPAATGFGAFCVRRPTTMLRRASERTVLSGAD